MTYREKTLYIMDKMKNIGNNTPALLVGGAADMFKKVYRGNIYHAYDIKSLREFVAQFRGLKLDSPIVLDDLSRLNQMAQATLLKIIEDGDFPFIILSSEDKVSSIILSRIKTFIKFPREEITGNKYQSIPQAQREIDAMEHTLDEDGQEHYETLSSYDYEKFCSKNCPDLLALNLKVGFVKHRESYLKLLGDKYEG